MGEQRQRALDNARRSAEEFRLWAREDQAWRQKAGKPAFPVFQAGDVLEIVCRALDYRLPAAAKRAIESAARHLAVEADRRVVRA